MKKTLLFFILFLVFLGVFIFAVSSRLKESSKVRKPVPSPKERIVCTQDVKECPDGSFVGREGSNCEFEHCPADAEVMEDRLNERQKEVLIKIFFGKKNKSCNEVFPVERKVQLAMNAPRLALLELLKGPDEKEKKEGYFTSIPKGVDLKRLTVENGIARAEFDEGLDKNISGSCKANAIKSQITQTLKQFTVIKEVIVSINRKTEGSFQL